MGKIAQQSSAADARYQQLLKKYGKESNLRKAGAASLIGADILEGYNEAVNEDLRADAIQRRQREVSDRGEISLLNIAREESKVLGAQEAALVKSGVKMEGSALNVLADTTREAAQAKLTKQRETSYIESQLEVEKILSRKRAESAGLETLLNVGLSAAKAYDGSSSDNRDIGEEYLKMGAEEAERKRMLKLKGRR